MNKQSGEIEQFTVETFRTVRVHFSSENSSDFAGFNVSFQNCKFGLTKKTYLQIQLLTQ